VKSAFFWLAAFYFIYCARPEDWLPGFKYIPLAKVTAIGAMAALFFSLGKTKRHLADLPREARYLIVLVCWLLGSSMISPVWKGGAFLHALDFSKVAVIWVLTFLLVTNFEKLRTIIFIQAASVAVISVVAIIKGHNTPRLAGFLGGIYDNSNDFAFAIVISLPFCLAFLLQARGLIRKLMWMSCSIVMCLVLFLTASRSGFIDLVVAGSVCLWHFGVKGRRPQLLLASFIIGTGILLGAGGVLQNRFRAMSGDVHSRVEQGAYGSYEERRELMFKSFRAIADYPLFGIGARNFMTYSGIWKEVHNSYLQIAAEGGIPALVLYVLFFWRGFANLRQLRKRKDLEPQIVLFVGALHSSLVGFAVGALFCPEAYNFFPYFSVAQTSVILAIVREQCPVALQVKSSRSNLKGWLAEVPSLSNRL
jgi:O-antigen ligase